MLDLLVGASGLERRIRSGLRSWGRLSLLAAGHVLETPRIPYPAGPDLSQFSLALYN